MLSIAKTVRGGKGWPAVAPTHTDRFGIDGNAVDCNEVRLVGRLAAPPRTVELPSGQELVTWRLIVRRPEVPKQPRRPTVDTIDCQGWTPQVRRQAALWQQDDMLELHGSLHRRFWRAPQGLSSRYEVEVTRTRRLGGRRTRPAAGPAERSPTVLGVVDA